MKRNKCYLSLLAFCIILNAKAQFTCGDSLLDSRDGQKYATVLIGSDCWFKQNLNFGTMVISDSTGSPHSNVSNNLIPEKYVQYNNPPNALLYGGLYDGQELMEYIITTGGQGLCPVGWHVSTDTEWSELITNAGASMITSTGGVGGNKLKENGIGVAPGVGTDDVGFSALLGGDRDSYGIFYGLDQRAIFWTSTMATLTTMYHYTLWAESDTIERLENPPSPTAFSCRCVENSTSGINDKNIELNISIYPNPAFDYFTIHSTSYEELYLKIYSINGGIVFDDNVKANDKIPVKDLVEGIYYYVISTNDDKWQHGKLMVIK